MPAQSGARSKIDRARQHFDAFNAEAVRYLSLPHEIIEDSVDEQHRRWILRMAEVPPRQLGLVLGDLLHNLRSALDHVVWDLTVSYSQKPIRGTAFPIALIPNDWESYERKTGKLTRTCGLHKVRGVAPEAIAAIKGLQPYVLKQNAKYHPLAMLNALDNRDKHQTLNVVAAYLLHTQVGTSSLAVIFEAKRQTPMGFLEASDNVIHEIEYENLSTAEIDVQPFVGMALPATTNTPDLLLFHPWQMAPALARYQTTWPEIFLSAVTGVVSFLEPFLI